jgi:CHAD domain-containing protein
MIAEAVPPPLPEPAEPANVGPFLTAKLLDLSAKIDAAAPRVLATGDDEAVHDLRVALRRARTALEIGRTVFGRFRADETRRALRDVQSATGVLRDEEVLLELIEGLGVDRPDVRGWLEARRRREKRLRSALRRSIRSGGLERGRELIDALLAFRVKPARERRLLKFAVRAVDSAVGGVERVRDVPIDDVEGLHELRIACKRLRYTIETFSDVLPPEKDALAAVATRLQKRLGDVHDIDVALACVRRARALTDVARRALTNQLTRDREERIAAYLAELAEPGASLR